MPGGRSELLPPRAPLSAAQSPRESPPPLCATCRFNVLRRYLMAAVQRESRGCWHHIVSFPNALTCDRYQREPGVD